MKKIISAALAASLVLGLAGCTIKTPDTVGSIGDVTITGGMYLLQQFNAYSSVTSLSEEDAADVKAVLKSEVTDEDGNTMTGSEYVAAETQKALEYYAAVETEFARLNGELTEEDLASVDSYTDSMWSYYETRYTENGIGKETLRASIANSYKASALLNLIYGADGEQAVSDEELTAYLEDECIAGEYVSLPLYDSSTYVFADEDTQTAIEDLAAQAVTDIEGGQTMEEAAATALPAAIEALGSTYDESMLSSYLASGVLYPSDLAQYEDSEGNNTVKDTFFALENGQAGYANLGTSVMVLQRMDPLEVTALDSVRATVLDEMKYDELQDDLYAAGAALTHALDSSAMNAYAASNIKYE